MLALGITLILIGMAMMYPLSNEIDRYFIQPNRFVGVGLCLVVLFAGFIGGGYYGLLCVSIVQ